MKGNTSESPDTATVNNSMNSCRSRIDRLSQSTNTTIKNKIVNERKGKGKRVKIDSMRGQHPQSRLQHHCPIDPSLKFHTRPISRGVTAKGVKSEMRVPILIHSCYVKVNSRAASCQVKSKRQINNRFWSITGMA